MSKRTNKVGYKNPPKSKQFQKGQSGNLNGRPKGRHKKPPYEEVLGQKMTVTLNEEKQTVTAEEAFLLKLCNDGVKGSGANARILEEVLTKEEHKRAEKIPQEIPTLDIRVTRSGTLGPVLRPLRLASKLRRYTQHRQKHPLWTNSSSWIVLT